VANYPHNKDRPESVAVMRAVEAGDMESLRLSLSPRMRAFCEEYIVDYNGRAACIRAGYSPTWADRQAFNLMKNKGIAAYIDHLTRSKEAKITAINPDYVIQRVTQIINDKDAKHGDMLRGLELLARHLGMFIDRTELTGKDGGAIKHEQISEDTDNFAQMIQALRRNQAAQEAQLVEKGAPEIVH
jgi:phage terminase small subunit